MLGVAVLTVLGTGCGEKPEDAYSRLVFHARMGNEEAFLEGFTEQSRPLIKTLLALRRTYGDVVDTDSDPYMALVLEEVAEVSIEEKEIELPGSTDTELRKVATLRVTDGQIYREIIMIEYEDGWKIDALHLQKIWAENPKRRTSRD